MHNFRPEARMAESEAEDPSFQIPGWTHRKLEKPPRSTSAPQHWTQSAGRLWVTAQGPRGRTRDSEKSLLLRVWEGEGASGADRGPRRSVTSRSRRPARDASALQGRGVRAERSGPWTGGTDRDRLSGLCSAAAGAALTDLQRQGPGLR